MKEQDKELLLKDLCARLPYEVKLLYNSNSIANIKDRVEILRGITVGYTILFETDYIHSEYESTSGSYEHFKPYLRPMSSMTEEEIKELVKVKILSKYGKEGEYFGLNNIKSIENIGFSSMHNEWFCDVIFNTIDGMCCTCFSIGRVTWETTIAEIDLLNKHHIDFHGLIPMGLALQAPDGMYNFK